MTAEVKISLARYHLEQAARLLGAVWEEVKETTDEDLPTMQWATLWLVSDLREIETWGLSPSDEKENGGPPLCARYRW